MTAQHTTAEQSIAAAGAANTTSRASADVTYASAISTAGNSGWRAGYGSGESTYIATVTAAATARAAAKLAAEAARQLAIWQAREALRGATDFQ
jgi:hypothetical protein